MDKFNEFIEHLKAGDIGELRRTFKPEYLKMKHNNGCLPIHIACENGNIEIVKFILRHQADHEDYQNLIDACDDVNGNCPIHFACKENNIEVAKLLLQNRCDLDQYYNELIKIARQNKGEMSDLLKSAKRNRQMSNIAAAMGLKCSSLCFHIYCFNSSTIEGLKKKGEAIGNGSYGTIYKCVESNREFAMKLIPIDTRNCTEKETKYVENDINKYRNLLRHDNIVEYFGTILEPRSVCIFMEYIAGGSLGKKIFDTGALPCGTISRYSKQILEGLTFLHDNNILHRDVKPQNILLTSDDRIKLTDFGLSRSLQTISSKADVVNKNSKKVVIPATTFCGTANYMAPEVIHGNPYSFPADIWSMGATVIEMLTGKPPYADIGAYTVIFRVGTTKTIEFDPPASMSDDLKVFIEQMVKPIPGDRSTARDLLNLPFITTNNQ